jgi:CDP-diglyceride synthetase
MGCLLALLAAISPRLALVLVWIFTNLVDRAFEGFLLPLLGLIFLPLTTLIYVLAYRPVTGVSGWGWFFVFLGLLFDLASYGGGALGRRR